MGTQDLNISIVLEQLNNLTNSEKQEILSILSHSLIQDELKDDFDREELTEKRFAHDKKCPHCASIAIIKNGLHHNRQRFLCKDCHKTFGETTNTVLCSTKKEIGQWIKFAWCMVRGFSLERCHSEVEISTRTAFFWRHKILFAISKILKNDMVDGVVEADETYFLESAKGKRDIDWKKLGRTPRKRGGKAEKRGISDEQVCVICSLDRMGNILSDATGKSRPKQTDIERFFDGRLAKDSILCTDDHNSYKAFARNKGIQIKQIPTGKHKIGLYHIQHVNSYHSHLKGWMKRFNGVATKYLNNYLNWYKWLTLRKGLRERDNSQLIIANSYMVDYTIRWSDFKLITETFS